MFRAVNHPSSFSQSERHKYLSAQTARSRPAMCFPQVTAQQQSKRLVDSEQNLQQKSRTGECSVMTRGISCNHTHLKADVRLKSPCFHQSAQYHVVLWSERKLAGLQFWEVGKIESLWDCNFGRWGLERCAGRSKACEIVTLGSGA